MFRAPELPGPSQGQLDSGKAELLRFLGSRVLFDDEISEDYRSDDSRILGEKPLAVVLAESSSDIETALTIAKAHKIPVVPRAGGSGRTGGAVPLCRGIVLATAGMSELHELDGREGFVRVGPGARLSEVQAAVEREGWFYPPDPNSAELCCIAGNVAENAAGPRAFKYGATRDYVLGIETILPGGQKFFAGRKTRKGVTGYDVVSLLVGSEGTLAAFGDVTLKLIPKPEEVLTLAATFPSLSHALGAVGALVQAQVPARCLEFLDEKTLAVMRQSGVPLAPSAEALLIIEVDGSEAECEHQAERILGICEQCRAIEVRVALLATARAQLWDARKQMSRAVRARARHKISEDVVVPRRELLRLVDCVRELGDKYSIDALSYGHAGDGNLHVNFLWNDPEEETKVAAAVRELFVTTLSLGGTLSGEHGIGLLKAEFLPLEHPRPLLDLEQRIKATFDPLGIMNPGKIFPSEPGGRTGHGAC